MERKAGLGEHLWRRVGRAYRGIVLRRHREWAMACGRPARHTGRLPGRAGRCRGGFRPGDRGPSGAWPPAPAPPRRGAGRNDGRSGRPAPQPGGCKLADRADRPVGSGTGRGCPTGIGCGTGRRDGVEASAVLGVRSGVTGYRARRRMVGRRPRGTVVRRQRLQFAGALSRRCPDDRTGRMGIRRVRNNALCNSDRDGRAPFDARRRPHEARRRVCFPTAIADAIGASCSSPRSLSSPRPPAKVTSRCGRLHASPTGHPVSPWFLDLRTLSKTFSKAPVRCSISALGDKARMAYLDACQEAGQPRAFSFEDKRGKSGLHDTRVAGNARRERSQGKCHREHTADGLLAGTGKGERVR